MSKEQRKTRRQAAINERKAIRVGLQDESMRKLIIDTQKVYFKLGYDKCREEMSVPIIKKEAEDDQHSEVTHDGA